MILKTTNDSLKEFVDQFMQVRGLTENEFDPNLNTLGLSGFAISPVNLSTTGVVYIDDSVDYKVTTFVKRRYMIIDRAFGFVIDRYYSGFSDVSITLDIKNHTHKGYYRIDVVVDENPDRADFIAYMTVEPESRILIIRICTSPTVEFPYFNILFVIECKDKEKWEMLNG